MNWVNHVCWTQSFDKTLLWSHNEHDSVSNHQRLYCLLNWIELIMFVEHSPLIKHYCEVIMSTIASQTTSVSIVYSTVCSYADQRKHQSSALLALCTGNSPVTDEFPAQRASNAENVSIWWCHHENANMCQHTIGAYVSVEIVVPKSLEILCPFY